MEERNNVRELETIVVHGGLFHTDDVLCVVLAKLVNPAVTVVRANVIEDDWWSDPSIIIADIGRGAYDHHQDDTECRADGKKHAACGLIFRDVADLIFPTADSATEFEKNFIIPIEDQDNGAGMNPLSIAVSAFAPLWDEEKDMQTGFNEAVDFMMRIVKREIDAANSAIAAEKILQLWGEIKNENGIVVMPLCLPWQKVYCQNEAVKFVVYPSARGGYNLQTVPTEAGGREAKIPLPESWLSEKPEGCTFCHTGLFLAAFDTAVHAKEAALTLVN